ncbi:hypothetical protein [Shewanella gelidii]|uniref:Uncharacterized protein n=1 Tax=Shewanella gelidii TaxID=1642821 RepID=A0A917JKY7_9GAMM|nr:hypothetical protein [Shewanella gelidii]MCL1097346.1 hypothetical protein [Shewanella gelidii]GGI74381.1 hypothetical protein GCM10009332_09880 [Shewanella gelidii]
MNNKIIIASVAGAIIIIGIVAAILIMPPMEAPVDRSAWRRDTTRLEHLKILSDRIQVYWQSNRQLPATVGQLIDGKEHKKNPKDPRYSTDYEYNVTGQQRYQLCAIFSMDTPKRQATSFWNHPGDHFCFDFHIGQEVEPVPAMD